jgi:hypothetical protein
MAHLLIWPKCGDNTALSAENHGGEEGVRDDELKERTHPAPTQQQHWAVLFLSLATEAGQEKEEHPRTDRIAQTMPSTSSADHPTRKLVGPTVQDDGLELIWGRRFEVRTR